MRPLALCLCLAALAAEVARSADAERRADDERILKRAGIATDDAGLLNFFKKSSPSEADIRALIAKLGDDSFDVREKASADLSLMGAVAEPFLREAAKSGDAEVRLRAAECLKSIGGGPSAAVLSAAARLLAQRRPPGALEVLLAYAPRVAGQASEMDLRAALVVLALHDGKPEPALVKALEDKAAGTRAVAAAVLVRAGARESLPAIRKLLNDPEPSVRLETALALASLKEKESIPVLIDLLAVLPRDRHAAITDLLYELAEDQAPEVPAGEDEAARKQARDAWAAWWKKSAGSVDLTRVRDDGKFKGYTMVILLDAGRILEVDADGKTRWQIDGLEFPLDAQRLPGDRVLVAEQKGGRVTERDRKGHILWEKRVDGPLMAQRLSNGNTFIANRSQVVEVDRSGRQVFAHARGVDDLIMKAQKLERGEVALVVSSAAGTGAAEYIRLDAAGKQVARFPVGVRTSGGRIDVLPDGRVLAPLKDQNKVVEYDAAGKVVWQADFNQPIAAVRLANGHTLVTAFDEKRAVELDSDGKTVWEYKTDARVTRGWRR